MDKGSESIKSSVLTNKLPIIVYLICVLQPILDVLSYVTEVFDFSNFITLGLRCIILLAIFLIAFLVADKKRVFFISIGVLALFTVCHVLACISNGYNDPISDLTNLVRIYQMPLYVLCFISFIKANEKVYKSLQYGLVICFLIIVIVEAFSVITGTNPYTYENKSIGIIGWFNDGSAQSSIISALVPVFLATVITRFKSKPYVILLSVTVGSLVLFLYATRLAYLSLLITLAGLLLLLLITETRRLSTIIPLGLALLLFVAIIPFSPMQQNQNMVGENAVLKQENIDNLISEYEVLLEENNTSDENYKIARLEGAYRYYLGGLVDRFGLEETVIRYSYSEEASKLCDVRLMKNTYCSMLIEEQGVASFLFGMELADMTYNGQIYDVENDLNGIFFLCGAVGLMMMFCFILYFVLLIGESLFSSFKTVFNIESAGWAIALITLCLHIYATCGVLRRPSASFYLSVVLAVIPFLINKAKERNLK